MKAYTLLYIRQITYICLALATMYFIYLHIANSAGMWGIFHYYIGAKYSKELGYFNVYNCAVSAYPNLFSDNQKLLVRDLSTYRFVKPQNLPQCPQSNFTASRWEKFQEDIARITKNNHSFYRREVLTDKGLNPPPFWAATAGITANSFPLKNAFFYALLFNLDIIFIFLSILLVLLKRGLKLSLFTAFLIFSFTGTFGAITNSYFQYLWFPFFVTSILTWQTKKYRLSGFSLAVASGLQMFPIIFTIPIFILGIISFFRKDIVLLKKVTNFIAVFVITIAISFSTTTLYFGKVSIWKEWYTKISIHKNYIKGEIFNIGFSNLIGTIALHESNSSYSFRDHDLSTVQRNKKIQNIRYAVHFGQLLCLSLVLFGLWKKRVQNPFLYGYPLIYFFLTLSPYYYLSLSLIPLALWGEKNFIKKSIYVGLTLLFLFQIIIFSNIGQISFFYIPQLLGELGVFFLMCIIVIMSLKFDLVRVLLYVHHSYTSFKSHFILNSIQDPKKIPDQVRNDKYETRV